MNILSIARNTFTESIRQPIFVVMLMLGLFVLVLLPAFTAYTFDDDNKLLLDLGMFGLLLGGLVLAAFTATGVLAREIENKTALTVISKPVSRPAFILGKYLGVTAAVALAYYCWCLVFLLDIRHQVMQTAGTRADWPVIIFGVGAGLLAASLATWGNYFYNWVFTSRFSVILAGALTVAYGLVLIISKRWEFQPVTTEFTKDGGQLVQILMALLLVFEAVAVLCALAVACSTRVGQVMTLVICLAIYFLGLMSDFLFGRFIGAQPAAWIGYALLPNIQFLFLADALTQKSPISAAYIGSVTAYTALYITAVLSVAVALFQTRETG